MYKNIIGVVGTAHTHVHTRTHMYTHVHTLTHTYTHVHTHTHPDY